MADKLSSEDGREPGAVDTLPLDSPPQWLCADVEQHILPGKHAAFDQFAPV